MSSRLPSLHFWTYRELGSFRYPGNGHFSAGLRLYEDERERLHFRESFLVKYLFSTSGCGCFVPVPLPLASQLASLLTLASSWLAKANWCARATFILSNSLQRLCIDSHASFFLCLDLAADFLFFSFLSFSSSRTLSVATFVLSLLADESEVPGETKSHEDALSASAFLFLFFPPVSSPFPAPPAENSPCKSVLTFDKKSSKLDWPALTFRPFPSLSSQSKQSIMSVLFTSSSCSKVFSPSGAKTSSKNNEAASPPPLPPPPPLTSGNIKVTTKAFLSLSLSSLLSFSKTHAKSQASSVRRRHDSLFFSPC